jgi:hypothetical protein
VGLLAALGVGGYFLFFRKSVGDMVMLNSVPSEARVLLNGKEVGKTPTSLAMKPGQKVTLEHVGFYDGTFEYANGATAPEVRLQPIISEQLIRSEPEGATIVLDGMKLEGVTPFSVKNWNLGTNHSLSLTKENQVAHVEFAVGVAPNQIYVLKEASTPATAATVGIDPNTPGLLKVAGKYSVRVKVNGKDMGDLRVGAELKLPPGEYKIELSNAKVFYKDARALSVSAGQSQTISLPGLVSIKVNSHPGSGLVMVDGQPTTVMSYGEDPISIVKGRHVIGIQGKSVTKPVDLDRDQTVDITT